MPFPGGNKPHAVWRPSSTSRTTYKDKPIASFLPFTNASSKQPATRLRTRRSLFLALAGVTLLVVILIYFARRPSESINWRRRAIVAIATDQHSLCNALMLFAALHAAKSRPHRVLVYPEKWDLDIAGPRDRTSQLLVKAQYKLRVQLRPVEMFKHRRNRQGKGRSMSQSTGESGNEKPGDWAWWDTDGGEGMWDSSVNVVKVWELAWYDRLLVVGGDVMVKEGAGSEVDALFDLDDSDSDNNLFVKEVGSSDFTDAAFILTPGMDKANRLRDLAGDVAMAFENATMPGDSIGHEVLRLGLASDTIVLPRQKYILSTSDLQRVVPEQLQSLLIQPLVHFSDPPLPKPWVMWPNSLMMQVRPKCVVEPDTPHESGCEAREMWMKLYDDYRKRRRDVCGLLSVPAPQWPPKEALRF